MNNDRADEKQRLTQAEYFEKIEWFAMHYLAERNQRTKTPGKNNSMSFSFSPSQQSATKKLESPISRLVKDSTDELICIVSILII